jgi:RNA polymerase sigma-70 factor (ECF subfamily)
MNQKVLKKMRQNCEKTALLDKFISGDHAAFCEIYNNHKQQISVFVKRRGAFYSKNSEDIVQNVFQKVYEKRSFFDPAKGSISNWIYTIALRESISFFRKSKKIKLETTVFDAISQIKEVENINIEKLNDIDELDRNLIISKYLRGMSFTEISHAYGIPENTVKTKVYRSIHKIKSKFSKEYHLTDK